MKTFPLRDLVRSPKAVKKLTASGESVRITDNGHPLWLVSPAPDEATGDAKSEAARKKWMDEYFAELLAEPLPPPSVPSLACIVLDSRRNF